MNAALNKYLIFSVQLIVMEENPFWWDADEANIESSVVFLRLFTRDKRNNKSHQLNRLVNNLDIYFSPQHISKRKVTGQITKRYDCLLYTSRCV